MSHNEKQTSNEAPDYVISLLSWPTRRRKCSFYAEHPTGFQLPIYPVRYGILNQLATKPVGGCRYNRHR